MVCVNFLYIMSHSSFRWVQSVLSSHGPLSSTRSPVGTLLSIRPIVRHLVLFLLLWMCGAWRLSSAINLLSAEVSDLLVISVP